MTDIERNINYYFADITGYAFPEIFTDCVYPWQALLRVKELMKGDRISDGAKIDPSVKIDGPVWIADGAVISHAAYIRPYTVIGAGCSVGHGSELKHCILLDGAKIASLAFCGDSIIGKSARLGSGVITANRKFNQTNIMFKGEDQGSDFFGLALGDYSRLGANVVTQPGTHIGRYSWIYPLTNVRGFIPSNKRVFHDFTLVMEDNESVTLNG